MTVHLILNGELVADIRAASKFQRSIEIIQLAEKCVLISKSPNLQRINNLAILLKKYYCDGMNHICI